jgi:hypothetical protein
LLNGRLFTTVRKALEYFLPSVGCCSCLSRNEGLQLCSVKPQHPRKNGESIHKRDDANSCQEGIGFQRQGKHQLVFKIAGSRTRNQLESRWQIGFFLARLILHPEDWDMFLRNVGWHKRTTRRYIPEYRTPRSIKLISAWEIYKENWWI